MFLGTKIKIQWQKLLFCTIRFLHSTVLLHLKGRHLTANQTGQEDVQAQIWPFTLASYVGPVHGDNQGSFILYSPENVAVFSGALPTAGQH